MNSEDGKLSLHRFSRNITAAIALCGHANAGTQGGRLAFVAILDSECSTSASTRFPNQWAFTAVPTSSGERVQTHEETIAGHISALRFFFAKVLLRPYREIDLEKVKVSSSDKIHPARQEFEQRKRTQAQHGSVFLVMADKAGKARINLSISNDGPALTFFDPSGQARTILGSTTAVPSHVNDNGIAEPAPPSSIVFFDNKGKLLFRTP
jgi:hypothetical protein